MSSHETDHQTFAGFSGAKLVLTAVAIAFGNFLVVLDTTITNVSIPHIAGSLGVSSSQGTWAITSYAVAEAITVPLTGFLASRFGALRVFLSCYMLFGVVSLLCGLSTSLSMLIGGRVVLGLVGGPIMPLSQLLLLQLFPKEKATFATIIWAMTTLVAPVAGPILGGIISDNWGWSWIFYINVPFALIFGAALVFVTKGVADPTEKNAYIDKVGLALLIIWIGALQIMIDEGRNQDWFASTEIVTLGIVAIIGFIAFIIWELTEKHPIVDLRVFRHRGYTAVSVAFAVGFGAFFATVVLLPLWLQQNMGYTATWSGYATGIMGILAIISAPMVGKMLEHIDPRKVMFAGVLGLAGMAFWRTFFNQEITFLDMAIPTLLTGPFMVMFFVPSTGLALSTVEPKEQASAAGLTNFMRTLAGAIATALAQTGWADAQRVNQTELAGAMDHQGGIISGLEATGRSTVEAIATLDQMVQSQSVMLATIDMFHVIVVVFLVAGALVWLTPRPKGAIDTSAGH